MTVKQPKFGYRTCRRPDFKRWKPVREAVPFPDVLFNTRNWANIVLINSRGHMRFFRVLNRGSRRELWTVFGEIRAARVSKRCPIDALIQKEALAANNKRNKSVKSAKSADKKEFAQ